MSVQLPPSHAEFRINQNTEVPKTPVFSDEIILHLVDQDLTRQGSWKSPINRNEIWELWLDEQDRFVFTNPRQDLLRQIIIDQDFSEGLLLGNFREPQVQNDRILPQDLEIVFFVNWLAKYSDVILHAAGFAMDGKGVVFTGPAGVGKSTLAAALEREPSLTILGEDQVLLRYLDGQFWIFGTPWHENPLMCSPVGVPLGQVFFLEKNGRDQIQSISPAAGVTRLLQTAFIPYYRREAVEKILERLVLLSKHIPFNTLSYRLGTDVLSLINQVH